VNRDQLRARAYAAADDLAAFNRLLVGDRRFPAFQKPIIHGRWGKPSIFDIRFLRACGIALNSQESRSTDLAASKEQPRIKIPRRGSIHDLFQALIEGLEKLSPEERAKFQQAIQSSLRPSNDAP